MTPPFVKLGDVIDVLSGFAFKSEFFNESDGLPVVRIRDVVRGYTDTYYTGPYTEQFVVRDGDILIGMDGNFNAAKWRGGRALLNQRVCKVTARASLLDEAYLFHYLPIALRRIEDATPFVTVKHLSAGDLREERIPLPPLPEQRRIAAILDRADTLRTKRREALAQLDRLAQSIFVEMFLTQARWSSKQLGTVAQLKRGPFGGALKKEIFVLEGPMVYEQRNAIQDDCLTGRYFITPKKYLEMADFAVRPGDLIVSCSGTLGKVAIVPEHAPPGIINQALLRVRADGTVVTSTYLKYALESEDVQNRLTGLSHGTGLQNFPPMSEVRSLEIPVPPMNVQLDFERRLRAVEDQKRVSRKADAATGDLFASIQRGAFQGGL